MSLEEQQWWTIFIRFDRVPGKRLNFLNINRNGPHLARTLARSRGFVMGELPRVRPTREFLRPSVRARVTPEECGHLEDE